MSTNGITLCTRLFTFGALNPEVYARCYPLVA